MKHAFSNFFKFIFVMSFFPSINSAIANDLPVEPTVQPQTEITANPDFILEQQILNKFQEIIQKAESYYLEDSKNISFQEKLITLNELYEFKKIYRKFLIENKTNKPSHYKDVEELFLPITKEVIRHLEVHLETTYDWKEVDHFLRIAKPITYCTTLTALAILSSKILKKLQLIDQETDAKFSRYIAPVGGATITSFWLIYNYKDDIQPFFKKYLSQTN